MTYQLRNWFACTYQKVSLVRPRLPFRGTSQITDGKAPWRGPRRRRHEKRQSRAVPATDPVLRLISVTSLRAARARNAVRNGLEAHMNPGTAPSGSPVLMRAEDSLLRRSSG